MWQKLKDFFVDQFDTENSSDQDRAKLEEYINTLMKAHEVGFVMTICPGQEQYDIGAALILEHTISFKSNTEKFH